jgi:hypothetical protein
MNDIIEFIKRWIGHCHYINRHILQHRRPIDLLMVTMKHIASIICYAPGLFDSPFALPCQISAAHKTDRASQELLQYRTKPAAL